jgi:PAS domain S-box-containing protein
MAINKNRAKQKTKPVILVVDDQPQDIELLEAYLVPLGYEIVKAANGEEALGKLSSNQIDLILLDVIMPGMDGFEVTRRVRGDDKKRLLPIILITSLRESEDRVKGIEAGCDDFISKPVDKMELFARIRSLLKVKDYNDLMSNYRKELESEVNRRTEELKSTLENLKQEITERKRAEKALKASEQNFRNSMDESAIGIRIVDTDGKTIYANRAILNIYGYDSIEELKATPVKKRYTPESYAEHQMRKEKRQRGESVPSNYEIDIMRKDGEIRRLGVFRKDVLWNGKTQFQVLYNDVTDHKRAEEALRLSEQNFRNSLDNSLMGIRIIDADWHTLYVNRVFLDIFSYKNINEVSRTSLQDRYTPEEHTRYLQRMGKKQRGESVPDNPKVDIIGKDGTIRNIRVYSNEVLWDGKQQRQLIYHDITELQKGEEALKASEQNFRNSLDSSLMGIYVTNTDWHALYVNQAFLNMFGYENIDESRASPPHKHYTPESYADYLLRSERQSRGELNPDNFELDIIHKDGTIRHLQVFRKEVLWDGMPQSQLLYNDITERVQAEEVLKLSEQNFRNSMDSSSMGIRIMGDADRTLYANQALLDIFGYKNIDELRASPPQEQYTPASYAGFVRRKDQFARGESLPDQLEFDIIRKDGAIRHLQISSRNVFWDGRQQFQILYSDITERKQAEKEKQELEAKAQVASRLAAVGEMAAGIAHEINNPLTGVIGFSQLLLEKQNIPEDIKEDIRVIADGSRRVADIVKRLLTFARQTKPVKTLVNLNELIENTLKLRDYVLKTANIEVVTRFDPELPWSIVDPGQLQQVFLNLIVNAEQEMKKAHGKGTLTITTEKKENNISVSFKDDGPGITKENLVHLFEPFFTTKAIGEGTGLGLSLSRSIILEHNGTLNVESMSGHGATFVVELPIIEALPSEAVTSTLATKVEPAAIKKGKILVVDDEPGVRALLEKVLTQSGHSVDTIGDASKAIDKLDAGVIYDVILTDIRMPGMNGTEMYSHILEKTPEMKNRIIFITGDVMGADIKVFLTQNNLPYLAKPFDLKLLKEKIDLIMMADQLENNNPAQSSK